jgi:hypothetical protein
MVRNRGLRTGPDNITITGSGVRVSHTRPVIVSVGRPASGRAAPHLRRLSTLRSHSFRAGDAYHGTSPCP